MKIEGCDACQELLPSLPSTPPKAGLASKPMEAVGLDLMESEGKHFLIMSDRYSGYVWVKLLISLTTIAVLKVVDKWFLDFGFPQTIRSDGGPQFRGEFEEYCKKHGIIHELSAAHNHPSNGLAEAAVKSVKYLLIKCSKKKEDFDVAFAQWKQTPRADNLSPAELFFGRRPVGLLPQLPVLISEEKWTELGHARENSKKKSCDEKKGVELTPLKVGEKVNLQIMTGPRSGRWTTGEDYTILEVREDGQSYKVSKNGEKTYLRNRRHLRRRGESVGSDAEVADSFEAATLPTEIPQAPVRRSERLGAKKTVRFK